MNLVIVVVVKNIKNVVEEYNMSNIIELEKKYEELGKEIQLLKNVSIKSGCGLSTEEFFKVCKDDCGNLEKLSINGSWLKYFNPSFSESEKNILIDHIRIMPQEFHKFRIKEEEEITYYKPKLGWYGNIKAEYSYSCSGEWFKCRLLNVVNDRDYPYVIIDDEGDIDGVLDVRVEKFNKDHLPNEDEKFELINDQEYPNEKMKNNWERFEQMAIDNSVFYSQTSNNEYNWDEVNWINFEEIKNEK